MTELFYETELLAIGELLLNNRNPALFIVLLNTEDIPTLTEAMNELDFAIFMVAMENEIEKSIEIKAFVAIEREP